MAFEFLTNVPLHEACEKYTQRLLEQGFGAREEIIPVQQACHRVSARPIYARISAPHYNAAAMDGIAVFAQDTFGATETTPIVLRAKSTSSLSAHYIFLDTGDALPAAYDAVIMMEDCVFQDDGSVKIFQAAVPFQHVRQIGEDICQGEMILPSHTTISPAALGSLLAGGVLEVAVLKKPLVGIIPTGDEVILPSDTPQSGDIIEFNSSIFTAMLEEWGALVTVYPICKDSTKAITQALTTALAECDMVLLNAGSSAGREDFSLQSVQNVGEVLFHGIAIKPGKPAILAHKNAQIILGVPGYPVSGIIVMEEVLKPLLEIYTKKKQPEPLYQEAVLARSVVSGVKYQEYIRVRLGHVQGRYIASPLQRGSGVVSSFMKADGIMTIAQGVEGHKSGDVVNVRLLQPLSKIQNSLVVIGSHDPLLDELSDMLHRQHFQWHMVSSHVGSMGGIMAAKRNEAHLGGVHLLDEEDGSYNISYVKKHFPQGGVQLVEVTGREQGFMVAKGNPKNIRGVEDLYASGIRFVNRQKGSGTRILFDYSNKQIGGDPTSIYGYEREEFTHTSVAAQIALGSADVGMGIFAAAKMFDLDFIPVCTEQYDFLIPDFAMENPRIQALLGILQSVAFRNKLMNLGGYVVKNPGRIYTF